METLNQRIAAQYLGISEGYLSKILSGKSQPRKNVLENLSKKTNSKAEIWIFGTRIQKESAIKQAITNQNKIDQTMSNNINQSHQKEVSRCAK